MMLMFMVHQLGKATARVHTVHFMSADKTNCLAHSGCSLYLLLSPKSQTSRPKYET